MIERRKMKKISVNTIICILFATLMLPHISNAQTLPQLKTFYDSSSGLTIYSTAKKPIFWNEKTFFPYICSKGNKYWLRLRILCRYTQDSYLNLEKDILKIFKYQFPLNGHDYFITPTEDTPQKISTRTSAYSNGAVRKVEIVTGHDLFVTDDMMPIIKEIANLKTDSFYIQFISEKDNYPSLFSNSFIEDTKKVYSAYMNLLNQEKEKPQGNTNPNTLKDLQQILPGHISQENEDFRYTHWGMSPQEVMESVPNSPLNSFTKDKTGLFFEPHKWNFLNYEGLEFDIPVIITYHFLKSKLFYGMYRVMRSKGEFNEYMNDFNTIKEALSKKYGTPKKDFLDWKDETYKSKPEEWKNAVLKGHLRYTTVWENRNTEITLLLKQKILDYKPKSESDFEVTVVYKSTNLIPEYPIDLEKMEVLPSVPGLLNKQTEVK